MYLITQELGHAVEVRGANKVGVLPAADSSSLSVRPGWALAKIFYVRKNSTSSIWTFLEINKPGNLICIHKKKLATVFFSSLMISECYISSLSVESRNFFPTVKESPQTKKSQDGSTAGPPCSFNAWHFIF